MNHIGEFLDNIRRLSSSQQRRCGVALLLSLIGDSGSMPSVTVDDLVRVSDLSVEQLAALKIVATPLQLKEYVLANNVELATQQVVLLSTSEDDRFWSRSAARVARDGKATVLKSKVPVFTYAQGMSILGIRDRIDIPPDLISLIIQ